MMKKISEKIDLFNEKISKADDEAQTNQGKNVFAHQTFNQSSQELRAPRPVYEA